MTLKHENFDSSSDEEVTKNYTLSQYLNFLLKNILNVNLIYNSEDFKLKLALILHNLADRFLKYSTIRNTYKKIKSEIFTVDNNSYKKNLQIIKTSFDKHLNRLFTDDNKENISDTDYKKLFYFLFNSTISIPEAFTLKNNITADYVKKTLLDELKNSNINLNSISNNPLSFTINNPEKFLAFTQVIGTNNRNDLKHRILEETTNDLSTIYKLPHTREGTFTINHIVHYKTGNIQTDIHSLGTYDKILSGLNQSEYKHAIIKRIFEVVHGEESTQTIEELPRKLNHFAEKLTHLLFMVEIHRNNATLFTAPMFLELINDDTSLFHKTLFPMAMEHAVAQARGVIKNYKYALFNSRPIDYDTTNIQNGNLLLIKEGEILIKWLSEKLNNSKLANIAQIFDILASIEFYKNMDNLKINDIKSFLEKVNKLNNCPTDLLNSLNQNLTVLIVKVNSMGERNLKLAKTKLLEKKDFSQDLKDLIEITYLEFTESLKNIEEFLAQKKAALKDDIKKILPEILQILCDKIEEWYNIDAPSYITDTAAVEEKILKDVTLKFNQTTSPTSSKTRLKFSLSNNKKRERTEDEKNYSDSKFLKTTDEALDVNLEEYYKLMGESFSDSISV